MALCEFRAEADDDAAVLAAWGAQAATAMSKQPRALFSGLRGWNRSDMSGAGASSVTSLLRLLMTVLDGVAGDATWAADEPARSQRFARIRTRRMEQSR